MGFPLDLAIRYMQSKKRAFVSVGTIFAILGVWLGVAALTTVMSVTGGFREEFRQKVLGVNAHVMVLKYSADFREYREVMEDIRRVPGVIGAAPFVINPMMVTHGEETATGVLLKGIDPELVPTVLDLPKQIVEPAECNSATGGDPLTCIRKLRIGNAKPPERRRGPIIEEFDNAADLAGVVPSGSAHRPFLKELGDLIDRDGEANAGGKPLPDAPVPAHSAPQSTALAPSLPELPPLSASAPPTAVASARTAGEPDAKEDVAGRSTTPEGGWSSSFLDDAEGQIVLPSDVAPDACQSADPALPLPGIIVGSTLRDNLKARVGDCIQVTSPTIGFTYTRDSIRAPVAKQFRVVGVFDAGFDQYDAKLVFTDLYESQAYADGGDSVTGVEIKVNDVDRAREIKQVIDSQLSNGLYHTMDWEELNHGLFTALQIQQILMSMVLGLIIVVAAFTVIATLIMVVLEKKKEIAVIKAMGASDFAVLRTFLYQGAIIGIIGTAIGLAMGYISCKALLVYGFPLDAKVYFISRLPVQVRPLEFALVGVFAVTVCLVATVWPALYAARLRPAEAFRDS